MTKSYCLKCGDVALSPFPYPLDGRKHDHAQLACNGRVIPIATICDPPEPTVIEASDLAPGMVVVAVDEPPYGTTLLATPDVVLLVNGETWAFRMSLVDEVDALWVAEGGEALDALDTVPGDAKEPA